MGEQNKFVTGMLVGAFVGAAISLLDKETRESTASNVKKCSEKIWKCVGNPSQIIENISSEISNAKGIAQELSKDIQYIIEKVNEIKQSSKSLTEGKE